MKAILPLVALCGALSAGFAFSAALPVVSVVATDDYAAKKNEVGITNRGLFTFSRAGDLSGTLRVYYTITGTATPGADYEALPASIVFAPGASSAALPVNPIYSRTVDPTESVALTLLADPGYEIGTPSGATVNVWHYDYDDPSLPTVVVWSDGSGGEQVYPGGFVNTVVFTVIRSGPTNLPLIVEYSLGGTGVPGVDYTGDLSGQVTIPAGTSRSYVELRPVDDALAEGNEFVTLILLPTPRYQLNGRSRAEAEILDNESVTQPTINQEWTAKKGVQFRFRVNGLPGATFLIQSSTNLTDWTVASPQLLSAGEDFIDPAPTSTPRRFFRALPQ